MTKCKTKWIEYVELLIYYDSKEQQIIAKCSNYSLILSRFFEKNIGSDIMKSSMMINIKLNDIMTTIYEEFDEALVRKDQNEVFKSLSYLEYLYINQEFSSEQITLRSSRYFKNIVRNKNIYDDYQINLSKKIISKRYNLSYRRVEQLLN